MGTPKTGLISRQNVISKKTVYDRIRECFLVTDAGCYITTDAGCFLQIISVPITDQTAPYGPVGPYTKQHPYSDQQPPYDNV